MKKIIKQKKICIISDSFPPLKNSASGMIYNLARELKNDNFDVTCIYGGKNPQKFPSKFLGYKVSDLKLINSNLFQNKRSKNVFSRFFAELSLAFLLSFKIFLNKKKIENTYLIIWYGPSSFLWLPVFVLKIISKCKVIYIVRDIFPEWLLSVGLLKKNITFYILKFLTFPQYIIPNFIGVESKGNLKLLKKQLSKKIELEVIYNWPSLSKINTVNNINEEKKIFLKNILNNHVQIKKKKLLTSIYLGNSGYAQNFEQNMNYVSKLNCNNNFYIDIFSPQQSNFKFDTTIQFSSWSGIDDDLIPSFISKKDFGIISLHNNLFSHNLPGKFVTYMQFKLPVLCISNKNTEISKIISKYKCGEFIDINDNIKLNSKKLKKFINNVYNNREFYSKNSNLVFRDYFDLQNLKVKLSKFLEK